MDKVFVGAEAKIRMKKDKITLKVESDKKPTNPKPNVCSKGICLQHLPIRGRRVE